MLLLLFRNRPTLAPELLREALAFEVPAFTEVRFESADLADLVPAEYRANLVVLLVEGRPVLAIVVEAQLSADPRKRFSWPVYLTALRARFACPAVLLVVTPDAGVASWCAEPIELGHPGWTLAPLVLGPDAVPVVLDAETAGRAPELSVLSAIAHGRSDRGLDVVLTTLAAAHGLDDERASLYADLAWASLNEAAKRALEAMMESGKYEFQSPFAKKYFAEGVAQGVARGEAKGEARALFALLDARGIDVSDDVRARILGCEDPAVLESWVRRAASAGSAAEIFD